MTIEEVKQFLQNNPQYYSSKNETKIQNIKTYKKYYFISDCGHEFYSRPENVIRDWKIGCPICSGRVVAKGINDFNSIYPELSRYLVNYEDGNKYTYSSNKVVNWRCPDCGNEWRQSFSKMALKINKCSRCGINNSYAERIMSVLLDGLCVLYDREIKFDWSGNKRYDFYLFEHNTIIEMHGKQHYHNSFPYKTARNEYEEMLNDEEKYSLAMQNGISEYIVIDASKSDFEWIKNNICNSPLPTLLCFSSKDIDWKLIDKQATSNLIKDVCSDYNNGASMDYLIQTYGKSRNTIRDYLKKGASFGWCNYEPQKSIIEAHKNSGIRVIETMSKPVVQLNAKNGETINEFPSIQEAQRQLKVSHIWDCIVGRRNTAGGYKWKYK